MKMSKLSRLLAEICKYDPDFYEESFEKEAERVMNSMIVDDAFDILIRRGYNINISIKDKKPVD